MRLRDYLDPSLVFTELKPADKTDLLRELAQRIADHVAGLDAAALLRLLEERERQGNTAVDPGRAIPHAFVPGLERALCSVALIPQGVDFGAKEGPPVHVAFVLLSPPGNQMNHIRLLARISRVAHRAEFVQDALKADTPEALFNLLTREDASHVD